MNSMTALVCAGTSVLVHAHDPRDATQHAASRAWREPPWRDRGGRTRTQVLDELYLAATRMLRPTVDSLLTEAHALGSRHGLGWWDSLIVVASMTRPLHRSGGRPRRRPAA
jgi:hypothetical protein